MIQTITSEKLEKFRNQCNEICTKTHEQIEMDLQQKYKHQITMLETKITTLEQKLQSFEQKSTFYPTTPISSTTRKHLSPKIRHDHSLMYGKTLDQQNHQTQLLVPIQSLTIFKRIT